MSRTGLLSFVFLAATFLVRTPARADTGQESPATQPTTIHSPELEDFTPLGASGPSPIQPPPPRQPANEFLPLPDRWRIGIPGDYVQNTRNDSLFDPYHQNVLKGDYPVAGQDVFLVLTLTSDTLFEDRRIPIQSNSRGTDSLFLQENFIVSGDLFKGDTAYEPKDWEIRATGVANGNYTRFSSPPSDHPDYTLAPQELFFDKRLADLPPNFDFVSARFGVQGFTNDFRGFLFSSNEPGVRIYGTADDNRLQYNLAWFAPLRKDPISLLNEVALRQQNVFFANLYRQDFLFDGYTAQISFAANLDRGGAQYHEEQTGSHGDLDAYYLGWAGDGHIGRINLSHQFYQALGRQTFNPIAGRGVAINAQFFALELSCDVDFIRYHAEFVYSSGDHDPRNGRAAGFDSIFDNPNFAGDGFSYFTRQALSLSGTGLNLVNRNSFLPNLRTNKVGGEANFVNPGLLLYNLGADINVTPRLTLLGNASYLQFDDTSTLRLLLNRPSLANDIGVDLSLGAQYRPLLNNNVILTAGAAALLPASGFQQMYSSHVLYSLFTGITLTY